MPQLILPKGADQFWNADADGPRRPRCRARTADITPEAVARAALAELGNVRPSALAVADEIAAMPDPAEVLGQLVSRFGAGSGETTAA